MGVFISRESDTDIYKNAFEEVQRIIRISDEVRITLEKIAKEEGKEEATEKSETKNGNVSKLTSSKLAKLHGMKTSELLGKLSEFGYLQEEEGKQKLTSKSQNLGAEFKFGKHGPYFLWPENIAIK